MYKNILISLTFGFVCHAQHLPNVPSAEQVKTEGLNIGEINKVQMEKIEELTLYVIELKKEINLLKSTIKK